MRRVCFDTASNYYNPKFQPYLNTPQQARERFSGKSFTFHAATAFVYETGEYCDFTNHEFLFAFLIEADEIITFNGRTCDLIMLESLIGKNSFKGLWEKPHHDLKGWKAHSLEESIFGSIPELKDSYSRLYCEDRYAELSSIENDFIRLHLAGTYRDAKSTLELFRLYQASGDTDFTFLDLETL